MLKALTSAFTIGDIRLSVQASAGIALAPWHGTDVFTVMKRADVAMYDAKRERARVRTYRPETDTHTPRRLELLSDLRTAAERGELFLVYQPKVNLGTDKVTGVEALVRWSHPTRGLVLPDEFVTLAENTGMVGLITEFVLDAALDQVCAWSADGVDLDVVGEHLGARPHRRVAAADRRRRTRPVGRRAEPADAGGDRERGDDRPAPARSRCSRACAPSAYGWRSTTSAPATRR